MVGGRLIIDYESRDVLVSHTCEKKKKIREKDGRVGLIHGCSPPISPGCSGR